MSYKSPIPVRLQKGEKFTYAFETPRGSLVKCTVLQGKGKFQLIEDGQKVAGPYSLSLDPGKAYFVSLNTDRSPYYSGKCEVFIEGTGHKDVENQFLLQLPMGKIAKPSRKYVTSRKSLKRAGKK